MVEAEINNIVIKGKSRVQISRNLMPGSLAIYTINVSKLLRDMTVPTNE